MEFKQNEPIYLQIANYVAQNILLGKWSSEQKIPPMRDLALDLQVNHNTVLRSYKFLENLGAICKKRGIGFFVTTEGEKTVKAYWKEKFIQQDIPVFFNSAHLLNIKSKEILK